MLDELQGFQLPSYDDSWLKNYVFECKDLMYQAYFSQRELLPENQLAEVRFESLLEDPLGTMQGVYEQLELGEFAPTKPAVESYFEARRGHKIKTSDVDPEFAEDINHHWREYMEAFGYQ